MSLPSNSFKKHSLNTHYVPVAVLRAPDTELSRPTASSHLCAVCTLETALCGCWETQPMPAKVLGGSQFHFLVNNFVCVNPQSLICAHIHSQRNSWKDQRLQQAHIGSLCREISYWITMNQSAMREPNTYQDWHLLGIRKIKEMWRGNLCSSWVYYLVGKAWLMSTRKGVRQEGNQGRDLRRRWVLPGSGEAWVVYSRVWTRGSTQTLLCSPSQGVKCLCWGMRAYRSSTWGEILLKLIKKALATNQAGLRWYSQLFPVRY